MAPAEAIRIAARRLGLDHEPGRASGQLDVFVWVELAMPHCRITARIRPALGLDLEIAANEWRAREPKPFQQRVALAAPLGKRLEPFAAEPRIAGELLARPGVRLAFDEAQSRGAVAVSDDRVEVSLIAAGLSPSLVTVGLRAAIALARALVEERAKLPRTDHEHDVRHAWAAAAAARGGHFDPATEQLAFESSAGRVEASIERRKDLPAREWHTTFTLAFERPLSLPAASDSGAGALAELKKIADGVELDPRQLRARLGEPIRERARLEQLLDMLVAAATELEARFARGRGVYR